jgi:electron transport complex protein RnfB
LAHERYQFHVFQKSRGLLENAQRLEHKAETKLADLAAHSQHTDPAVLDKKRAVIEAALARSRAKRDASLKAG